MQWVQLKIFNSVKLLNKEKNMKKIGIPVDIIEIDNFFNLLAIISKIGYIY